MSPKKIVFEDVLGNIEVVFGASLRKVFVPLFNGGVKVHFLDESDECIENLSFKNSTETYDALYERAMIGQFVIVDAEPQQIPPIDYCDVTEKMLLSGEEIKKGSLQSSDYGVLAYTGVRKLKVTVPCGIFANYVQETANASLKIKDVNGEAPEMQFGKFACSFEIEKGRQDGTDKYAFLLDLDTDEIGKAFSGDNAKRERLTFGCVVELSLDEQQTIVVRYPLKFVLVNTDPSVCKFIAPKPASIDFGTSSTCVATWQERGPELLTLSPYDLDGNGNPYENPTNIMMYDWEAVYKEWLKSDVCPVFSKGDKTAYNCWKKGKSSLPVSFDFGYSVKDELGDAKETKILNSIMSLIKMIPQKILERNQQFELNPFGDEKKVIDLVCNPEQQDSKSLDPVAFYGYLIGRAVNDVSKHQLIHTRFHVTSPVKFSDKVKQSLCKSLKWGLSKTVPKTMVDMVEVKMDRSEPVAYIGAVCGTQFFKLVDGEPKPFAVFDFGGGTLDFAFGTATTNEDEGDLNVDVKMVGGKNNVGGETLIERLSYAIYVHNIGEMIENRIPIEKPEDDRQPDELRDELIKPSMYTRSNMNSISARISRKIFEGVDMGDARNENLGLYDNDGCQKDIEVSYDIQELESIIENVVREAVSAFKLEMDNAFEKMENFDSSKINIFLAGNSSKNKHVRPMMELAFPQNEIILVDQIDDHSVSEKRYAITPKTAVAIGQLRLSSSGESTDSDSFRMHVGFFNPATGAFKEILRKGDSQSSEWKKFKKIRNGCVDVYYSDSVPENDSMYNTPIIPLTLSGCDGKYLFVRIKSPLVIEYCVGDDSSNLSNDIHELSFNR